MDSLSLYFFADELLSVQRILAARRQPSSLNSRRSLRRQPSQTRGCDVNREPERSKQVDK
jgi:hypothetical protein